MSKPLGVKREVARIPEIIKAKGWYEVHFASYSHENARRALAILKREGIVREDRKRRSKKHRVYVLASDAEQK